METNMSKNATKAANVESVAKVVVNRYRIYTKDYNYKFQAASPTDAIKKAIDRQIWLENITDIATYGDGPEYISKVKIKITPALQSYQDFIKKEVKSGNKNYPNRYLVKPANKAKKDEKPAAKPKVIKEAKPKVIKAAKPKAAEPKATKSEPKATEPKAILAVEPKAAEPKAEPMAALVS